MASTKIPVAPLIKRLSAIKATYESEGGKSDDLLGNAISKLLLDIQTKPITHTASEITLSEVKEYLNLNFDISALCDNWYGTSAAPADGVWECKRNGEVLSDKCFDKILNSVRKAVTFRGEGAARLIIDIFLIRAKELVDEKMQSVPSQHSSAASSSGAWSAVSPSPLPTGASPQVSSAATSECQFPSNPNSPTCLTSSGLPFSDLASSGPSPDLVRSGIAFSSTTPSNLVSSNLVPSGLPFSASTSSGLTSSTLMSSGLLLSDLESSGPSSDLGRSDMASSSLKSSTLISSGLPPSTPAGRDLKRSSWPLARSAGTPRRVAPPHPAPDSPCKLKLWLKVPLRCIVGESGDEIAGRADYLFGYDKDESRAGPPPAETFIVVIEAKSYLLHAMEALPQTLAYMGIIAKIRKEKGKENQTVFGVCANGDEFIFTRLDNWNNVTRSKLYCSRIPEHREDILWFLTKILHTAACSSPTSTPHVSPGSGQKIIDKFKDLRLAQAFDFGLDFNIFSMKPHDEDVMHLDDE